jgi:hypothetical protein
MRRKRGKRRRRAKPARDQPDRAAGGEIAHLYQVLLAGQSSGRPVGLVVVGWGVVRWVRVGRASRVGR